MKAMIAEWAEVERLFVDEKSTWSRESTQAVSKTLNFHLKPIFIGTFDSRVFRFEFISLWIGQHTWNSFACLPKVKTRNRVMCKCASRECGFLDLIEMRCLLINKCNAIATHSFGSNFDRTLNVWFLNAAKYMADGDMFRLVVTCDCAWNEASVQTELKKN